MAAYRCELCGGPLLKVTDKIIGDSKYFIMKCQDCQHQVARHS